mmetsp:Transcript_12883/g.22266  ORF Transcript_12883/g.22266 Transcript_12883/m.22266 type:complete len:214 (+) Transcript_12883:3-644(+)
MPPGIPPGMPPDMPPGMPPGPTALPPPPLPPGAKPPKRMCKMHHGQERKTLQDSTSSRSRSRGSSAASHSGAESCESSIADSVSAARAETKPLAIKERVSDAESSTSSSSHRGSTAYVRKAAPAAGRPRPSRAATSRTIRHASGSGTSSAASRSRCSATNGQAIQKRRYKNGTTVKKEEPNEDAPPSSGVREFQDRLARLERKRKRKVLMSDL